jgi:glycosyltransferase involved in cell wall biosynthesis
MPAISIIVPVYKAEKYIGRCLDSILAQTFQDYEVILVDDGSPDRSGEICEMYAQKDTRFNVIHQPNRGVSCARMSGLKACKGLYVIQYDPDDWVESDMLSVLFQSAIANSAEVVICDYIAEKSGESVYHSQTLANCNDPILLSKLYLGQHLQLLLSAKLFMEDTNLGLTLLTRSQPFLLPLLLHKNSDNMSKSTHFFGQPVYGQLIKSLDHDKIVEMSRKSGGERYVKSFDGFTHLLTMLYAVIMRFDSLREIDHARARPFQA